MKYYVSALVLSIIALLPHATANAAGTTQLQLKVLPIDCIYEVINDGLNSVVYITPEECGQQIDPLPDPQPDGGTAPNDAPSAVVLQQQTPQLPQLNATIQGQSIQTDQDILITTEAPVNNAPAQLQPVTEPSGAQDNPFKTTQRIDGHLQQAELSLTTFTIPASLLIGFFAVVNIPWVIAIAGRLRDNLLLFFSKRG